MKAKTILRSVKLFFCKGVKEATPIMNPPSRFSMARDKPKWRIDEHAGKPSTDSNRFILDSAFCSTACNSDFMLWFLRNCRGSEIAVYDTILTIRRQKLITNDQCVMCYKDILRGSGSGKNDRFWADRLSYTARVGSLRCNRCAETSENRLVNFYEYSITEYLGKNILHIRDQLFIVPHVCYQCVACTGPVPDFDEHKQRYLSAILADKDNTAELLELAKQKQSELEVAKAALVRECAGKFAELNKVELEVMTGLEKNHQDQRLLLKNTKEQLERDSANQKEEINKRHKELTDRREQLQKREKEHIDLCKKLEANIANVQRKLESLQEQDITATRKLQELQGSITANEEKIAALTKSKQDIQNIEEYIKAESVRLRSVVQEAIGSSTKKIMRDANKILNKELRELATEVGADTVSSGVGVSSSANAEHAKHTCPKCKKIFSPTVKDDEHFTELHVSIPCGHVSCDECKPDDRGMPPCIYCAIKVKSTMRAFF